MKRLELMTLFCLLYGLNLNAQNKIDEIFKIRIEQSLISKENNFPDFSVEKDSLDIFLFALHKGFSPNDFKNITKFSNEKISKLISFLEAKNWLHKIENHYKPTVFIADSNDGKLLYKYAKPISRKITKSITENLHKIKSQFEKTEISKTQNFEDWSFLILSNILLDSWQIDNIERHFLKQDDRPLRNGKHYYYKISENTNSQIESFGIYGNQFQLINNKYISVYGNNRYYLKNSSSENLISKVDNKIFNKMAEIYLPSLLKILENERNYSQKIYTKLGYDKEISFEEFFIWWYHFIYTQSTNEMNKKGLITIPTDGNFYYTSEE